MNSPTRSCGKNAVLAEHQATMGYEAKEGFEIWGELASFPADLHAGVRSMRLRCGKSLI